MALRYMTGFEEYAQPSPFYLHGRVNGGGNTQGSWVIDSTAGRFGGKALANNISGGGEYYRIVRDYSNGNATVGFAYKFNLAGKATKIARWMTTFDPTQPLNQVVTQIGMDANNLPYIDIGDPITGTGTLLKGTEPLLPNRYYYIEWRSRISTINSLDTLVSCPPPQPASPPFCFPSIHYLFNHAPANTNQLQIDGKLVVDTPSALDVGYLNYGGLLTTVSPTFGNNYYTPWAPAMDELQLLYDQFQVKNYYDDFYLADNSGTLSNGFLGDCAIRTLIPTTGTPTWDAWVLSAGADKPTAVGEVEPDGDTTYLTDGGVGSIQTFKFPNMRTGSTSIHGLMAQSFRRKTDISSKQSAFHWKSPSVTYSPSVGIEEKDFYYQHYECYDQQDGTVGVWTPTAVNSLEAGLKLIK